MTWQRNPFTEIPLLPTHKCEKPTRPPSSPLTTMASVSTDDLPTESTPLLESQVSAKPTPTPIPKGQLAALCTVRIVEPIAFTQLFPYVNEFMSDLHLTDDPSRVGFYSGLVVRSIPISPSNTSPSSCSGKCFCSRPTYLHISVGSSLWSVFSLPNPLFLRLPFRKTSSDVVLSFSWVSWALRQQHWHSDYRNPSPRSSSPDASVSSRYCVFFSR